MSTALSSPFESPSRYAKCIEVSKRIRWDIEQDVIRGRSFDFDHKFLPDGLSLVDRLGFFNPEQAKRLSQLQGRTYANMFGLVERFINAKMLEISRHHWFGDQTALEALIRFSDEELKHQALFKRIEQMMAHGMAPGYQFVPNPDAVARAVMATSTWAVLALTCHIELFTQIHYRQSLEPDNGLSPLFKDVFLFHWKEESQHAILDELEWRREDERLNAAQRDEAVTDLIGLVHAVDGIVQQQARADTAYFLVTEKSPLLPAQAKHLAACVLSAYRWQYLLSGLHDENFNKILSGLLAPMQIERLRAATVPLFTPLI